MNIEEEDVEEAGEGWLVSYADMMTLIACFFILMMAFANYDPVGFTTKSKKLASAFRGRYKSSDVKLTRITEEVSRHPQLKKMFKISMKDSELLVTFSSSLLYAPGEFKLTPEQEPFLDTFIDIVRAQAKTYRIMVEGHASSYEGRKLGDSDLWSISAKRAAKVASRFEYFGYGPDKIVVIGKGESAPLVPEVDDKGNINEEAARQNQTVMIRILEPKRKVKSVKFGFGIFFND